MKRTTVFIDEAIDADLHALARRQQRPVAAPVRDAVEQDVVAGRQNGPVRPAFVGMGSGRFTDTDERTFVASLAAGELGVEPLTAADLTRCDGMLDRYPALGFVDASLTAMAERLRVRILATTDRRHFTQVRPAHLPRFAPVP